MTTKQWYRLFYTIIRPFLGLVFPLKFTGRENIPAGGALVCANHSSGIDPLFISFALTKERPICAMAKESLLRIPVLGKLLKLVGTFGVKRGASDIHAVKHALECLNAGEYVVLFPEGTRVRSREEGQPKTGAAMLACRTGKPVVPIYLPMKKRPFRWNRVYIGEPMRMVPAGKRATPQEYEQMTGALMDRIYGCGDGR